jgi:AraC family transcriptional regulator
MQIYLIYFISKGRDYVDWLDRMNNAMNYIEENLTEDIDYAQVARMACCSVFHFQRMFPFITGISLSEYIRRRRLTLAAFELQSSDIKVIDVAVKYGYQSTEAFSRAFKNLHGVMPVSARETGTALKAYPRMTFYISIKGDIEMNYRIEQKESFEMLGLSTDINAGDNRPYIEIPEFWRKCIEEGKIDCMHKDFDLPEDECVHAGLYNFREGVFSYMICHYVSKNGSPSGYTKLIVPPLTWAVFSTGECTQEDGTEKIHNIWKRIYPEWFPTSGYEHADGPEFEMYFNQSNGKFIEEVWIPVVKK